MRAKKPTGSPVNTAKHRSAARSDRGDVGAQPPAPRTLTERKREEILRAAAEAFRHEGFRATSADRIAERARVSKRTLYNHFPSKDALFDAVIASYWARLSPLAAPIGHDDAPVEARLAELLRTRLAVLLDPEVLGIFRAVLAESVRTPELARAFRQGSAHLELLGFVPLLAHEHARGRLTVDDVLVAAGQLWGLVFEGLFWPSVMLLRHPPGEAERERAIREGICTFLARFGPAAARTTNPDGTRTTQRASRRTTR